MSTEPRQPPEVPVDWAELRRQMPVARRWAYLDHAAVAPLSGPARAALHDWAEDAACNGDTSWTGWNRRVEEVRYLAAAMIHAQPDEIALVKNTTEGVNLVAEGFPWQPGDNVVTLADEFPTNQYPWMNLAERGIETRRVATDAGRVDLDRLAAACDDRTRIVTISWVSFSSGWRNDVDQLAQIAHSSGALLFLDAIQGLGVFELDVGRTAVDFLAADGHKWLLGPEGAGIFYVRREHLARLRPAGIGWNSVVHANDFGRIELRLKDDASRYEGGSPNTAGMIALGASIKLLSGFGAAAISRRVLELTDLACRRLTEIKAVIASDRTDERRSGIVMFELPGRDHQLAVETCLQRGVVLSARAGRLRISPHAYNNTADIDRLIESLESVGA